MLLGVVSLRAGGKIHYDGTNRRVTNKVTSPNNRDGDIDPNQFLSREYPDGLDCLGEGFYTAGSHVGFYTAGSTRWVLHGGFCTSGSTRRVSAGFWVCSWFAASGAACAFLVQAALCSFPSTQRSRSSSSPSAAPRAR